MYNVLVVDDEILSRLGVVNLIDWSENGFALVTHVSNGSEGLEIIRNQEIDLVITDIKMPVMDGIELIEAVNQEGYECEFIVLSSFDDYEYVRKALKLGALDYILKLDMEKSHMETLLEKAKRRIEKKVKSVKETIVIDSAMMVNAKREFLKQMLYGRIKDEKSMTEKLEEYSLKLPYENYCVLMFKASCLDGLLGEGNVRQVIEGALADNKYAYIVDTGYDELSILCNFKGKSLLELRQSILRLSQRIIYIMNQYFNQKVKMFVSHIHGKIEEVPLAYLEVCQAHSLRNYASNESVIYLDKVMDNRNYMDYQSLEERITDIERALLSTNELSFDKAFEGLIHYINESKYIELSQIRHITSSLVYISNRYMNKYGFKLEELWKGENIQDLLNVEIQRKGEFIDFLNSLRENLLKTLHNIEDNHIIRAMKRYLNQHYRENIVIKDLPDSFGVTSTYLSMLFKKETGLTLKEYLINLKMNGAKKMLRETNNQIVEVAEMMGYDNEHYFSRLFKQKVGITPSQYRNSGIKPPEEDREIL